MGRTLSLANSPKRIVSLVPSQTELLFYLGLGQRVVGVTKFCERPIEAKSEKTVVGGTKKVHFDKITALSPDLIIGNKEENTRKDILRLEKHFPIWMSDIRTLEDALKMVREFGKLFEVQEKANALVINIELEFNTIKRISNKKALYLIWKGPYMVAGSETFIIPIKFYKGVYIVYFYSMGKRATITIKEDLSVLKKLKGMQTSLRKEKRLQALICLKEGKFATRRQLADYLGVHVRSLEKWVAQYMKFGIEDLVAVKAKRKGSKIITAQVHQGLEVRVNDAHNPFLGYWDAQQWVKEHYGVEVNYHRIREYLIKHFKTKVKRPRKGHIKKDPQAENAFFKTAPHLQGA